MFLGNLELKGLQITVSNRSRELTLKKIDDKKKLISSIIQINFETDLKPV